MVKNKEEAYERGLEVLKKPLEDIWSRLATEHDLDFIIIKDAKKVVRIIIDNAPNESVKAKFERLLDALRNPVKKGNVISEIINEFYK